MRDGPWWRQQCLAIRLRTPLVALTGWSLLPSDGHGAKLGLLVSGFTARQQAILRRLLGR